MLSDAHSGTTVVCAWAVQVQSAGRPPVAAADDLNETLTVSPRFPNTFQAAGWGRDAYRRKVSRLLLRPRQSYDQRKLTRALPGGQARNRQRISEEPSPTDYDAFALAPSGVPWGTGP